MTIQTQIIEPTRLEALERAKQAVLEIRQLALNVNLNQARIAYMLAELEDTRGYSLLGHADVSALGKAELDYSRRKTRDLVATVKRLESLPEMRERFQKGDLEWTKARTASAAAILDPTAEHEWVVMATELSNHELERAAARARGEDPRVWLTLTLTEEQLADINEAILAIRRERPDAEVTTEAALAELCRRAVKHGSEGSAPAGGPRHRVVITVCADCKATTREDAEGPVAVAPSRAAVMACDSEILDIREGPASLARSIPPRVANFVDARDRGRCRVPGCTNRAYLDRHHEGGFLEVGHDPDHVFLLCDNHHRARHAGDFVVTIEDRVVRFFRLDGVPLGDGFRLDDGHAVPGSYEPPASAADSPGAPLAE